MSKKPFRFQKRGDARTAEHCSVPLCTATSKFNSVLSFHSFPVHEETRKKWIINIRRDRFNITNHTKVCSRHFLKEDLVSPITPGGRHRVRKGSIPVLFQWNDYRIQAPRPGVWERREKPPTPSSAEAEADHEAMDCYGVSVKHHDYCVPPEQSALDMSLREREKLEEENQKLRKQIEDMILEQRFGLQRFAGSDEDIRFYTRFSSYDHIMAFWNLIEPATSKIVLVTRARAAAERNEEVTTPSGSTRQSLQPVDELFLFLMYLSVGLKEIDLGHRFNIHPSTVSRIIVTWINFLYTLLGSISIWMSPEQVQANLPVEFKNYPDTQVIIDCTELKCQTPSSLLLQSEMCSTYKSHCTMKGLLGMAPHGAVTFVSSLYAGSVSDKEIFKQSGIQALLTESMAVMADKGFLIDECVSGPVYRPPFLSKHSQIPAHQVPQTQELARLRVHVERLLRRVKENKLFDTIIPLSIAGSINELFSVACLLLNYQCKPLVKAWAKK